MAGILAGPARSGYRAAGPAFAGLTAWLVPLLIVAAGYQLGGAHAPGGAFPGGRPARRGGRRRVSGRTQACGTARRHRVAPVHGWRRGDIHNGRPDDAGWWRDARLPGRLGRPLILLIEIFATLSIGAALVLCYLGGETGGWDRDKKSPAMNETAMVYALTGVVLMALGVRRTSATTSATQDRGDKHHGRGRISVVHRHRVPRNGPAGRSGTARTGIDRDRCRRQRDGIGLALGVVDARRQKMDEPPRLITMLLLGALLSVAFPRLATSIGERRR